MTKKSNSGTSYEFSSKTKGMKRITLVFSGSQIYSEGQNMSLTKKNYNSLVEYFQKNDVSISYYIEQERNFREEKEINENNFFSPKPGENAIQKINNIRLQNTQQVYTGKVTFHEMGLKVYFDEKSVLWAGQKVQVKDLIGIKLTSPNDDQKLHWYKNIFNDIQYKRLNRIWLSGLLVVHCFALGIYTMNYFVNYNILKGTIFKTVYPVHTFIIGRFGF